MLVLVLIKKIISLFLIIFMGVALVKTKVLKQEEGKALSIAALYLIVPCMIVNAFQVDITPDILKGMLLSLVSALMFHIILLLLNIPFKKYLHLDAVEQVSIIYSNCGNLIVPLVIAMFGEEMVIYTTGFMAVQLVLIWSHCKSIICGEKKIDWKKIVTNVNMISIFVGLFLLVTGIKLTGPLKDAVSSMASTIGPVCMLVTGMLIGSIDLKATFTNRRLWLTCALRLIVTPLLLLVIIKLLRLETLVANGSQIMLISYLAMAAPSASTIVQMAQVYGQDAKYASSINVASTLLTILTMPAMIWLFTAWVI